MTQDNSNPEALDASISFLLACLRSTPDHSKIVALQQLAMKGVDWNRLFRLAEFHSVLPLLYSVLKDAPLSGMPAEFLDLLAEHYQVSRLRNRMLYQEFRRLAALLTDAGISMMILKGIVLADTLYEDSALRQFGDIDLLLHDEDIDAAKALLQQQGYHTIYAHGVLEADSSELTGLQEYILRSNYHQFDFQSEDGLIYIDLHWRLSPYVYPADISTRLAWDACVETSLSGAAVSVLPDELNLLYLCVHGAKDGWSQLKWVVDLHKLIEARPEIRWDKTFKFAEICHCRKMLLTGLCLAQKLLDTKFTAEVQFELASDRSSTRNAQRLSRRILGTPEKRFRTRCTGLNLTYILLCDRLSDRLKYILRVLSCPQARDCNLLGLNERLLPFWPWLRPFRISAYCLRMSLERLFRRNDIQETG